MFDSLQSGLKSALKTLQGKARLSESNMRDGLKLVEHSLLEADVSYSVVQDFMAKVSEKALGQKVLDALDPSQQVVGIVYDELVNLLGPVDTSLKLKPDLNVLMLCGLQGSGKTTTCGKLATLLLESERKPLLVAADLQRPAAIEQLHQIGKKLGVPVYSEPGANDPVKVCQNAIQKAKDLKLSVVILDTAGRLAIDEELMQQLVTIEKRVQPDQVYLVVDGTTGQDAVNSAGAFNDALELDGVIMTKLDGDARGGALLSVKHVTGVPVKFVGTGEHYELATSLEPFVPEGMASRILGQGDMLELIRTVRSAVDAKQQAEMEARLQAGEFTLDDFKKHIGQLLQPGLMMKMLSLIPGMGDQLKMLQDQMPEKDARRLVGMIDAMTPAERRNPKLIDVSRRTRIAKGSGVAPQQVNELIKQFDMMAPMVKMMSGKGGADRMQMMRDMQNSGMFNPGARFGKPKGDTGRRLSNAEKAELKKRREKELRRKKRKDKGQG